MGSSIDEVVRLGIGDYEEAIAHLSLVFGEADFAALVPSLYRPTEPHMGRNLAVRRDGRIAAIVGLFPIDWIIGGTHLRLAGIGGVSVHPDHRGNGLMRLLMDAAMREVSRGGYHAACLGGNRRRYGHWGFEKAGVEASILVTGNSLAHTPPAPGTETGFCVEEARASDHPGMMSLYERLPIRCVRSAEDFPRHLRNWRRVPVVARDYQGRVAAYACVDAKNRDLVDCCARTPAALEAIVRRLVENGGSSVRLTMPLIHTGVIGRMLDLADDVSLIEASNWRIYDWPAVVGALLTIAHESSPLGTGVCIVRVIDDAEGEPSGVERVLRIAVDPEPRCVETDDPPEVTLTASQAVRMFAGPLPAALPRAACPLAQWRPLPLMIPMQDRI